MEEGMCNYHLVRDEEVEISQNSYKILNKYKYRRSVSQETLVSYINRESCMNN